MTLAASLICSVKGPSHSPRQHCLVLWCFWHVGVNSDGLLKASLVNMYHYQTLSFGLSGLFNPFYLPRQLFTIWWVFRTYKMKVTVCLDFSSCTYIMKISHGLKSCVILIIIYVRLSNPKRIFVFCAKYSLNWHGFMVDMLIRIIDISCCLRNIMKKSACTRSMYWSFSAKAVTKLLNVMMKSTTINSQTFIFSG